MRLLHIANSTLQQLENKFYNWHSSIDIRERKTQILPYNVCWFPCQFDFAGSTGARWFSLSCISNLATKRNKWLCPLVGYWWSDYNLDGSYWIGKKFKGNGEELGTKITRNQFAKTLVLSCIVVGCTYLLVFSAKYFFNSDFRFWSYAIRPFGAGRVLQAVRYLPLFAVFHIANALAVYRNNFTNWSENKRIAFSTLACLLPILIMLVITYVPILFTGVTLWSGSGTNLLMLAAANGVIRLYPFVITLAVISIINVKTQKLTGNIWLGTLINTLLFTMITVANFDSTIGF